MMIIVSTRFPKFGRRRYLILLAIIEGGLYCVQSLIESPVFISCSILFIDPSFSSGD